MALATDSRSIAGRRCGERAPHRFCHHHVVLGIEQAAFEDKGLILLAAQIVLWASQG
jgi:hypothetical protein